MTMENKLKDIILQHASVPFDKEAIVDETDLIPELALDSIAIVNLIADLEESFDIVVNVWEIDRPVLNRFQWLKDYVAAKLEHNSADWKQPI